MNVRSGWRNAATLLVGGALTALALTGCGSSSSAAPLAPPSPSPSVVVPPPSNPPTPPPSSPSASTVDIEVKVADGKVTPTPAVVPVPKGSKVHLVVSSDVADEVHVHGYDIEKSVKAGGSVTFDFTADQVGVFEVETHETELLLFKLQVS